ncbi:MAG: uracil-DNA glycosylase [Deltaproteobacteria bacterium]|nr:uracil-DNA glycosylase [Deltaproteobacteria bacterium]TLN04563.1 MAG: uracil-DNA glycosylase [bacterium]
MATELHYLISSLKSYLVELRETGVDGLPYGYGVATVTPPSVVAEEPAQLETNGISGSVRGSETVAEIRLELGDCRRCQLGDTRTNLVFGVGNEKSEVVFVGEAPGRDEDLKGEPFVGEAGQLLTKIIQAMGLAREDVYICNVLKCRPPNNRNPQTEEIEACQPFLLRQLQAVSPKIIIALGTFAAQTLLQSRAPISQLRGQIHDYHGIPLMPTFHPAFLLRNPGKKREVWEDMKQVLKLLGREPAGS